MINEEQTIYTVSTLNAESATLLAQHFGFISVAGEISNLSRPTSGHLYFSLKDANAQIRCALFRFQNNKIDFALENGQQVILRAQVSLYEPRGDYQLIVKSIELAGLGALQIAFDQLKNKLQKAGLFDEKNKKPLPRFPKQIGIVTSPTAAALQDILNVIQKRFPSIPVIIYPTQVQGTQAAGEIVSAIKKANQQKHCDVLILARGGGSLEDLWPFNEEKVAYAIFESKIPIITGIGHQTDFTIADFVADVRAPTPSAAAEYVTPDRVELAQQLDRLENNMCRLMQFYIRNKQTQLTTRENLEKIMRQKITFYREKIAHYAHALETLSPLKVLQRGFSITTHQHTKQIIKTVDQVSIGDIMTTRVNDGEIQSRVAVMRGSASGKKMI